MQIKFEKSFTDRLNRQLDYIALDKKSAANKLKESIKTAINNLKHMPYMCRKSIYFDNDYIRDLIVNGYVITYIITADVIEIFGFTKFQNGPSD